jgi:GIY-YIG catalytic domain
MEIFLKAKLEELLNSNDLFFADMKPSSLPQKAGVYCIFHIDNRPFYVGRSKNLQQRLYNNHLMGPLSNARLKKYLIDNNVVRDKEEAKVYIRNNCKVKWIFEDDYRKRGAIEGYFTGVLFPNYGIDEEH